VISLKIRPNDTTGLFHQICAFMFHEKILHGYFSLGEEHTENIIFKSANSLALLGECIISKSDRWNFYLIEIIR